MHARMNGAAHLAGTAGAAAGGRLEEDVQDNCYALADVLVVALRYRADIEHGRAGRVPRRVRRSHPEAGLARHQAASSGTLACMQPL